MHQSMCVTVKTVKLQKTQDSLNILYICEIAQKLLSSSTELLHVHIFICKLEISVQLSGGAVKGISLCLCV